MTNQTFNPPNLDHAEDLLNDLFTEVKSQESKLSGGVAQELTKGATAVQKLKETIVKFTDPSSRLVPLTVEVFKAKGIELGYEIQELMKQFDFCSMVMNVNPQLQSSVVISSLKCQLDFGERDKKFPLVYLIIPDSKWQKLVNVGANLNLGLDADLEIGFGVDTSEFTKIANLPDYDKFKASVGTKDEFKGFIILDGLNYKCGKFNLIAQGIDSPECRWEMKQPIIQEQSTIKFDIIFKVPKGWEFIDLVGTVWIEPSIAWLTGELINVIKTLPPYLKDIFDNKEKAAEKFAVGKKKDME